MTLSILVQAYSGTPNTVVTPAVPVRSLGEGGEPVPTPVGASTVPLGITSAKPSERAAFALMYTLEMETEIEAKFPDVDANALRLVLKKRDATLEHPEVLMRRRNYDYPDRRLEKIGGWIRVRD